MKKIIVFFVVLLLGIFTSCKNSLSGKITIADGKEPFTLNQDMVSRLAALAVTGDCKLDEQQVKDNVLSALSALSENSNERAAVTVTDFSLSAPKVATLKAPASFGKTERSANIQDFDEINLYLYTTNEGKDNEGWILASNDRRVGTIIAVVDGKYSEDDEEENPFMDIFYAGLENHILETVYTWNSLTEEDIRQASANKKYVTSDNYKYENWYLEDQRRLQYIDHFIWNQNEPFCNAIRVLKGNNLYVTGCGPTALAQIFAYYEWPETCTEKEYKELKQKWAPAKNWDGVYDWSEMKFGYTIYDAYSELSDTEKNNFDLNVGALLYDIGANSNANYTIKQDEDTGKYYGATSLATTEAKKALKKYGYQSDDISDYSLSTVINSLKNSSPVYMVGYAKQKSANGKTTISEGHAWVISGYAKMACDVFQKTDNGFVAHITDDYFLYCNVGWRQNNGHNYNGYYLAGVFDFSFGHCIVDIPALSSAEGDWYIRKKIEQHERAVVTEGKDYYYQFGYQMISNIRPEDY